MIVIHPSGNLDDTIYILRLPHPRRSWIRDQQSYNGTTHKS